MRTSLVIILAALCAAGCAGPDPTDDKYNDGTAIPYDHHVLPDNKLCLPDIDGEVEWDEVNFISGLGYDVVVNPPGTVAKLDPIGRQVDGKQEWDFSAVDGVVVHMKVEKVSDFWFAKYFPEGDIAMGSTAKADTLQILDIDDGEQNVKLLGFASREPEKTLTIYDPPIVAMKFPMKVGQRFTSCGKTKEGSKVNNLSVYTEDCYDIAINQEGKLRLPHLKLSRVLLIETQVTIKTLGGVTTRTRQLQWFAECYGEVVRALSQADEPDVLFTEALELRRLSL
jgi:hypothetical protein